MYEQDGARVFGSAHPVMLIGIAFFIMPFLTNWSLFSWVPKWFGGVGIFLIFVGAAITIYEMQR